MGIGTLTLKDIFDILSAGGTLAFAVLAIYAFLTERIVPRSRLDEQRADKREAIELAKQNVIELGRMATALETRNTLEQTRLELEKERDGRTRR